MNRTRNSEDTISYDELIAAAHEIVTKANWVLDSLLEIKEKDGTNDDLKI